MHALPIADGATTEAANAIDPIGPGDKRGGDTTHPGQLTLPDEVLSSPLARMVVHRARMRTVVPLDVVTFVAACPACGRDCQWTQERQETRVRSTMDCRCGDHVR